MHVYLKYNIITTGLFSVIYFMIQENTIQSLQGQFSKDQFVEKIESFLMTAILRLVLLGTFIGITTD